MTNQTVRFRDLSFPIQITLFIIWASWTVFILATIAIVLGG